MVEYLNGILFEDKEQTLEWMSALLSFFTLFEYIELTKRKQTIKSWVYNSLYKNETLG